MFCAKNIENKIAKEKSLKIEIKCVWGDCYLYNWGNSVSVAVTVEAVSQTLLPSTDTSQSSRMPTNLLLFWMHTLGDSREQISMKLNYEKNNHWKLFV